MEDCQTKITITFANVSANIYTKCVFIGRIMFISNISSFG